ncbi:MAG: sigma-70 family RNA polymerase sigma factor, partial [Planctomycetota bacterium]
MQEIPQTRASLLLQLNAKSEEAWTEFLAVYEKALLKFCCSKGLQEADCEDVIQDVLLAVINKISDWDPDESRGKFRGWLFRVARNVAVDVIDRRAKKAAASGDTQVARMLAEIPADLPQEKSFETEYQRAMFDWASQQVKSEVRAGRFVGRESLQLRRWSTCPAWLCSDSGFLPFSTRRHTGVGKWTVVSR